MNDINLLIYSNNYYILLATVKYNKVTTKLNYWKSSQQVKLIGKSPQWKKNVVLRFL